MWLRNCWYVIAWAHEVPPAGSPGLFHRTVLGERVLVYRTASGALAALADRCCHRLAPLSRGRQEGDCVRCGYHGLKFDASGACVEVPGMATVPPRARVRSYPVVQKNKWVFIWMGEADKADTALLPDNFSCDHPDWQYKPGYLHYPTPYLLICDNLLDFSHLSYVHAGTLGGSPRIAETAPVVKPLADGVNVTRRVDNVPAPAYYDFRGFDTPVDRWIDYDFVLPATLLMHSGSKPTGDTGLARAIVFHSCQTLTPETEDSTHYFFQEAHRGVDGDAALKDTIFASLVAAFHEDLEMITAQHENIRRHPDAPMLPLAMDSALMQFRRLLARRVADEAAAPAALPFP
ncbi:MAG: aromatic ring-hydroxylating dioxygenase subunit alpha [Comamonadaceae bacterium]|nr:MAG: aromatic ring-hydroxylating dioxygenase subunit alpha [Comamonadaceae bacterium]